jgi:predicted kinase
MSIAVILTGLPATGKSTLGFSLSQAMPAVLVSHDWISAALKSSGLFKNYYQLSIDEALDPGYIVAEYIALDNLRVGNHVVIDGLFHSCAVRKRIVDRLATGSTQVIQVWCTATDSIRHQRAVEHRERGIPGWGEISWEHIERVKPFYEAPTGIDITVEL